MGFNFYVVVASWWIINFPCECDTCYCQEIKKGKMYTLVHTIFITNMNIVVSQERVNTNPSLRKPKRNNNQKLKLNRSDN